MHGMRCKWQTGTSWKSSTWILCVPLARYVLSCQQATAGNEQSEKREAVNVREADESLRGGEGVRKWGSIDAMGQFLLAGRSTPPYPLKLDELVLE